MSMFHDLWRLVRRNPGRTLAAVVATCVVAAALWVRLGPIAPELLDISDGTSTVVVDRQGVPLYEALSGDGTRSLRLEAATMPAILAAATLAGEDRRFYSHSGIDPVALVRAMKRNLVEHAIVGGGSTITQQTAKLLIARRSGGQARGLIAKMREAVLAERLEHRFTKLQILALYLNLAAYGNQIVGAGRASYAYFGHDASMLTAAQAAFLAGLPQRPSTFNPYRGTASALARQRQVLRRMQAGGAITPAQTREAADEQLALTRASAPFAARHFVERVLAASGGQRAGHIETTFDAGLQAEIAGIINSHREVLEAHHAANVAVAVLDNATGEWRAWEGSGDYFDSAHGGAIDGVISPRQPGSALKPFTYALAFEGDVTPATVLADIPSHFPTAEAGVLYSPRNYDGRYRGPLLARRALAGSENVPAVALASRVGVPSVLRFLLRAGFTTFDRNAAYYGLGVTLGNAEVRLDELIAGYAAFARGGEWIAPTWRRHDDPAGRERRRLVSPRTAYWIGDILSDSDAREFVFGSGGSLDFPFRVAVKTGTSQAYRDNWTVGFTRDVTVGVWVGNFDRSELRNSSGVTGAAPIFHSVMLSAVKRARGAIPIGDVDPIVAPPSDLERLPICGVSGDRPSTYCPLTQNEWLPKSAPAKFCSWHHDARVDWPVEYRQWALECGAHGTALRAAAWPPHSIRVTNPPNGATYLIDPTLRSEFQMLKLRATADASWRVDGKRVSNAWPLKPGEHLVEAVDRAGNSDKVRIWVR